MLMSMRMLSSQWSYERFTWGYPGVCWISDTAGQWAGQPDDHPPVCPLLLSAADDWAGAPGLRAWPWCSDSSERKQARVRVGETAGARLRQLYPGDKKGVYTNILVGESRGKLSLLWIQVYLRCGLLGKTTILAHCVHLKEEEIKTLREAGAGVAHCPNSNFSLKSGVCDVRRLQVAGVKVKECWRGKIKFDHFISLFSGWPRNWCLRGLFPNYPQCNEDGRDSIK